MKENSGASARTRRRQTLWKYVIACLLIYVSLMTIYNAHFAGSFVPDIQIDEHGHKIVRRRPQRHRQRLDPTQKTYVYIRRREEKKGTPWMILIRLESNPVSFLLSSSSSSSSSSLSFPPHPLK